jgi:hypothetical protein
MKELIDFLNDRKKQGPTLFGPPAKASQPPAKAML